MSLQSLDIAKTKIVRSAGPAFMSLGYEGLTMGQIATFCGLTRRALYHHFSGKDELFRAVVKFNNIVALEQGEAAAQAALARGANALDVISQWLDVRFGEVRRRVGSSPHGEALNAMVFKIAADIMIEVSYDTNRKIAELIRELAGCGRLSLREGFTPERAARLVGDGARGVNQARPPIPNNLIAQHYREMAEAILYGCATPDTRG
jgi:AcrR family transcriptional regulator